MKIPEQGKLLRMLEGLVTLEEAQVLKYRANQEKPRS